MDSVRPRLDLLWISPLPPTRSGVADYAVELVPELARLTELRVVRPPGWQPPADWPAGIELVDGDAPVADATIQLFHLGNNPHHVWILDRLAEARGTRVVVLHDAVLHHLTVEATAARGDDDGLDAALAAGHGERGRALAAARRIGLQGRLDPFLFPARRPVLASADAVLVHSDWAGQLVRRERPDVAVGRVGLAATDPGPVDRAEMRSRLGIGEDEVVLMHLGYLSPEKGLVEILTAAAAAHRAGAPVRLVVVGEGSGADALGRAAAAAGLGGDRLTTTGWIEPELLPRIPAAADLGVVYRTPSAGETSAAVLRFFACGVPVAVGGIRQFLEWPETAAPRLTPGPSAAPDLVRWLSRVGGPGWDRRGRAAREAYLAHHRPEIVARELVAFLERL